MTNNDAAQFVAKGDVFLKNLMDKSSLLFFCQVRKRLLAFFEIVFENRNEQIVLEFDDRSEGFVLKLLGRACLFGYRNTRDVRTDGFSGVSQVVFFRNIRRLKTNVLSRLI